MIVGLLAIPRIGGIVVVIPGDRKSVFLRLSGLVIRKIVIRNVVLGKAYGCAVLLGNLKLSGGGGRAHFAFENGQSCLASAVELHAKVRGLGDADGFVGKL